MIKYQRMRAVKKPNRAHQSDAGIDFFIPEFRPDFLQILKLKNNHLKIDRDMFNNKIILQPLKDILIPSGIKIELPESCCGIFFNKSGVSVKKKLLIGACVIDEGYRGEIHIHLINTCNNKIELYPNEKIAQLIIFKLPFNGGLYESKIEKETERGENGFGSTG